MIQVKKILVCLLSIALVFSIVVLPVSAGSRMAVSSFLTNTGNINAGEWHSTDMNISVQNNQLVIPAETSTADTKFISKIVAISNEGTTNLIDINISMTITELAENEKMIVALGLGSIEAYSGETGNIEISFFEEDGLCISVAVYTDNGMEELLQSKKCPVALGEMMELEATITSAQMLRITLNGKSLYDGSIPVSGEGRFGLIQTGGCGAVVSDMSVSCEYYDTPENVNIVEDFEKGEFNANVLVSQQSMGNGLLPSYLSFEEYNGSTVYMFRNTGLAYIGTKHQYSNFEISFDIPYYLREKLYDETGTLIGKPCEGICIGIGEESSAPVGYAYQTSMDLVVFGPTMIASYIANKYVVDYPQNLFDANTNEGFSVKLTMLDGTTTLQVKSLHTDKWETVATTTYDSFRSGYINIYTTGNSNVAIDNLKILNMDQNGKTIEPEYASSVITASDYIPTEEDNALVFRNEMSNQNADVENQPMNILPWAIGVAAIALVVTVVLVVRKTKKEDNK